MKAVIEVGGNQYIVQKDESIDVTLTKSDSKKMEFAPLLVFDDKEVEIGTPSVSKVKVTAEVIDTEVKADKVVSIRYKAKKRVHKTRGHRQIKTRLKITKIS